MIMCFAKNAREIFGRSRMGPGAAGQRREPGDELLSYFILKSCCESGPSAHPGERRPCPSGLGPEDGEIHHRSRAPDIPDRCR